MADDIYAVIEGVVRAESPRITAYFRQSLQSSGLRRKSGKAVTGFRPTIKRDRGSAEVWGVTFSTMRYVYMHHHGMDAKEVRRAGFSYYSRGFVAKNLLTDPAQRGAELLGRSLARVTADFTVGRIRF